MNKSYDNRKINYLVKTYVNTIISILLWVVIFVSDDTKTSLSYLGVLLMFISLYQLIKVKSNSGLLILFGIIAYINISVALGECLQLGNPLGEVTMNWQMATRMSEYNVIGAKSMLLLMSILNLCINTEYLRKIEQNVNAPIKKKENNLIFFVGFFILLIFWLFGYKSVMSSTYESNTRTIYEYCITIFIIVWFYSGKSKGKQYLLYSYSFIYILQSVIRGDRSSAFPMILVLFLIIAPKVKVRTIIVLAIVGIFASNIIAVYRETYSIFELKSQYLSRYGTSFFLSDTVSQSYYTGITIVKVHDLIPSRLTYFIDFLIGIILGGDYKDANVASVVYNYEMHKGGGFYYSWFYFWFGYIGVAIGSLVLGYIIRFSFNSKSNYIKLFNIALIAMSFRWYLYTPFVLFRSVIFIFTLLLLVCYIFSTQIVKKRLLYN